MEQVGPAERWQRRERVYWMLTGMSLVIPTVLIAWVNFDRDQIKSLVSQGKTVFVDVTAAWCVVCKSNKKLVINTAAVKERLASAAIAMRADWTSPDQKISAFLASFGRYGIPLNVVFGPAAPGGILLPELLTSDGVFQAIDKASGKSAALVKPGTAKLATVQMPRHQGP